MAISAFTIVLEVDGTRRKICKLLLEKDGSWFLTVPYHASGRVLLTRQHVNYPHPEANSFEPPIDYALLDDDEHRLKLSHHPDGFVQFSGSGITSGRNPDGSAKGMGLVSAPLVRPHAGPITGLTFLGVEDFAEAGEPGKTDITFVADSMAHNPWDTGYSMEIYYMPRMWTRFLRVTDDGLRMYRQHPSGAVLDLQTRWNPASEAGLVGVEMYPAPIHFGDATSGFAFGSPTGNVHHDENGDLVGEAIYASFPAFDPEWSTPKLDLIYRPLADPPYQVEVTEHTDDAASAT
jgi:hypothetical protein